MSFKLLLHIIFINLSNLKLICHLRFLSNRLTNHSIFPLLLSMHFLILPQTSIINPQCPIVATQSLYLYLLLLNYFIIFLLHLFDTLAQLLFPLIGNL